MNLRLLDERYTKILKIQEYQADGYKIIIKRMAGLNDICSLTIEPENYNSKLLMMDVYVMYTGSKVDFSISLDRQEFTEEDLEQLADELKKVQKILHEIKETENKEGED